ncbi:MAG: BlaI/MecI/CopY family transcriptional regulator [Ruminococcaceae bacterium]|nr:BlaI/MecI/CopY family transcriptional regulator [Oscillospiraceae bacterium]
MTSGNINIGEAELEIMKVLWDAGESVNSQYISEAVEDKNWKRTTILTFLTRLVDKGAIKAEKRGKLYYYTPIISQKEYRGSQTKNLIKSLYNGSVKDFALSLFEEQVISDKEIEELRAIFEDKE